MNSIVKYVLQFILLILLQVLVVDQISLGYASQFIIPSVYFLFVLMLPLTVSNGVLMLLAFLIGMTVDIFKSTPGMHASAMLCELSAMFFAVPKEQLRIFDSARAGGRTFGIHEYAMPPRHRVFFPAFVLARAAASTFSHSKAAKARPPLFLRPSWSKAGPPLLPLSLRGAPC